MMLCNLRKITGNTPEEKGEKNKGENTNKNTKDKDFTFRDTRTIKNPYFFLQIMVVRISGIVMKNSGTVVAG
ncbi:hypothetical protein P8452_71011 [Trifolium repens]|nr:hypothetical protein P8452_71011 [Trifolium repens]